jgi:hypothetical protein
MIQSPMLMNGTMLNEVQQNELDSLVSKGYTVEQALTAVGRQQQLPYLKSTSRDNVVSVVFVLFCCFSSFRSSSSQSFQYPGSPSTHPAVSSPSSQQQLNLPRFNPFMPDSPFNNVKDEDELALRTAMLISEQETEFGINMYQVVSKDDDMEVKALLNRGFTIDEAILWLFEHRGYKSKRAIDAEEAYLNRDSAKDEADNQSRSTLTRSVVDEVIVFSFSLCYSSELFLWVCSDPYKRKC